MTDKNIIETIKNPPWRTYALIAYLAIIGLALAYVGKEESQTQTKVRDITERLNAPCAELNKTQCARILAEACFDDLKCRIIIGDYSPPSPKKDKKKDPNKGSIKKGVVDQSGNAPGQKPGPRAGGPPKNLKPNPPNNNNRRGNGQPPPPPPPPPPILNVCVRNSFLPVCVRANRPNLPENFPNILK